MISNKSLDKLAASVGTNVLVRIEQNVTDEKFFGFVVGVGTEWLLMHCFNGFVSEGYRAFHMDYIVRATTKGEERWTKMLAAEGKGTNPPTPVSPSGLRFGSRESLESTEALLCSLISAGGAGKIDDPNSAVKVVTVDGEDYLGFVVDVYEKQFSMVNFSDDAVWQNPKYLKFEDVAYVAVGDPHTTTLAKYLDLP